jgi:hypothetical protein
MFIGDGANAYHRSGENPGDNCHLHHTESVCDGNYYSCRASYGQEVNQFNTTIAELNQEQGSLSGRLYSCEAELNSLLRIESDRRNELIEVQTKVTELQRSKSQLSRHQELQASFFQTFNEEANKLGEALPEIALRLRNLIENENSKIDLVLNNLDQELKSAQNTDEQEKIILEMQIFRKLKLAETQLNSNDPNAFKKLVNVALFGEGQCQVDAIKKIDPITYLVLKTVFTNKIANAESIGNEDLRKQIELIKNNMNILLNELGSELGIEQQKAAQGLTAYQDASFYKNNKEGECGRINARGVLLPQFLQNASAGVSESSARFVSCNRYCHNVVVDGCK